MTDSTSRTPGNPFVDPPASADSTSLSSPSMTTAAQGTASRDGGPRAQAIPSSQPQYEQPRQNPNITEAEAVLNVARNATLTLGTDALIVLDEGLRQRRRAADNFCGLLPNSSSSSKTTRAIPYVNILWASFNAEEDQLHSDLTIRYAEMTSKHSCRTASITYTLPDKTTHAHAERWLEALLNRAYPTGIQRRRRIKVLINPFGGQGHAVKLYAREIAPIFAAAGGTVDVERTTHRGHAVEIAQRLDVDAWDVVACASGDGLPHEVFNGLAKQTAPSKALRNVAVVQLPCGSGNAMSLNLNGTDSPSLAALAIIKGVRTPMDLVAITQGDQQYWSFLSQAFGLVADSDLGTERLRWMGGMRFTWGALVRILFKAEYPAEVSIVLESDDKRAIKAAHRAAFEGAASTKLSAPSNDSSPNSSYEQSDDALPALKYGTINSPLSPAFQTEDHPSLGNFYCGNMCWMTADSPFFATALPRDGLADLVTISARISRLTALGALTAVESGKFIDQPSVTYRKVRAYRITPRTFSVKDANKDNHSQTTKLTFSKRFSRWLGGGSANQPEGLIDIDGELVPFEPFQAEVVPSLGMVLSKRRDVYEFDPLPA